jgi:hypothetical protein
MKIYFNIINPKKAHHPEIEMWENLKENFSKVTL